MTEEIKELRITQENLTVPIDTFKEGIVAELDNIREATYAWYWEMYHKDIEYGDAEMYESITGRLDEIFDEMHGMIALQRMNEIMEKEKE